MDKSRIDRINELYRKSKAEGLSEVEKMEQQILRKEYIDAIKRNLSSQLDNISIQEKRYRLFIRRIKCRRNIAAAAHRLIG